jgi:hypothetical protein
MTLESGTYELELIAKAHQTISNEIAREGLARALPRSMLVKGRQSSSHGPSPDSDCGQTSAKGCLPGKKPYQTRTRRCAEHNLICDRRSRSQQNKHSSMRECAARSVPWKCIKSDTSWRSARR